MVIKKNNSIENLEVLDRIEHVKLHAIKCGEWFVRLKCPVCQTEFERNKVQTHLVKPSKYHCTCCCASCRGKLYREIQLHGVTHAMESAISENVLSVYKKYKCEENSEETDL